MTKEWSKSPSFFLKQPWVGRKGLRFEREAEIAEKWLVTKKGTVVAGAEGLCLALCVIEKLKKFNQYLRVAVVVPSQSLLYQWSEEIQEFFNFPEGIVGLIDGNHRDYFSKWTRILICTASSGINLLAEKGDSFIGRDLLLIGYDLKDSQLHDLMAIPHAYSLFLLKDNVSASLHKDISPIIEDSASIGSFTEKILEPEVAQEVQEIHLLDCTSLRGSDEYFSSMLSKDMLIGDIQLNERELEHLTSLIAAELKKSFPYIKNSLSVAVFLVWAGILYYQEGNYWTPVYEVLGLPIAQGKWQAILGEAFLGAIRKYGLLEIKDKQTYITPILAHGYVPDYYVDSLFNDCLWSIYMERVGSGLSVELPEVEHLVSIWRRDVSGFETLHGKLAEFVAEEKSLSIKLETVKNKDKIRRYEFLSKRLLESEMLQKVLSLPEEWHKQAEEEKKRLQQSYHQLTINAEKARKLKDSIEVAAQQLDSLELQIGEIGKGIFSNWSFSHIEIIAALSVTEVEGMIGQYLDGLSRYSGPLGWLFRLLMAKRYSSVMELREGIFSALKPLILKESYQDFSSTTDLLNRMNGLQELIAKRHELRKSLEELELSQLEVGSTLDKVQELGDMETIQLRLAELNREIEIYKGYITELGQGSFDAGCNIAETQRSIRNELTKLHESVPRDMGTLLACLPEAEGYTEDEVNSLLLTVRRKKQECAGKLSLYRNPLYSLNESTRAFVFQGMEKAVDFMYFALQFLRSLESGVPKSRAADRLPARIARAMEEWWAETEWVVPDGSGEQPATAKVRQSGGNLRKPAVLFEPQERVIKVCLPSEPVLFDSGHIFGQAKFDIRCESCILCQDSLSVRRVEGGYRTEGLERILESPEPAYMFKFSCGATEREWNVFGPGWLNQSILFNAKGVLVEDNILPSDGAWVIAPVGSIIEPAASVKERDTLIDKWSGYESIYVDLSDVEILMVRSGSGIDIYWRQAKLDPALIGGERIVGVSGQDGCPAFTSSLPGLVFSVRDHDELALYAIKIEHSGEDLFKPADAVKPVLSKDNAVLIELGRMSANHYGEFNIFLSYRNSKIWGCTCVVLPELKIAYPQPVYQLVERTPLTSRLTISSSLPFLFSLQEGDWQNYSYSHTVPFSTSQAAISGTVAFAMGEGVQAKADIIVDIPCIRWRWVDEDDWHCQVEEIWHGDLGEIVVKIPSSFQGPVYLSIKESRQMISRPVKNGIAVFDLNKFADSLKSSKQDLQEIIIEFADLSSSVLMRVRNSWLVDKVTFEDREEDGQHILNISWTELGKAENRVIRLWPLDRMGSKIFEYPLPDGEYSFEIREAMDKLLPGKYLLQFDEEDLWASSKAIFPEADSRNCIIVQLGEIIEPPIIQWRLAGEKKWQDVPGSLWHESLGKIELLLPNGISGDAVKIVGDGCQVSLNCIEGQKYEADCSGFREVVFGNGVHPYKIQIVVSGYDYEFLTVYSAWEVYDVVPHVFRDGDKWEFHVNWRETCSAASRIIRIWSGDFQEYKEWTVPDGEDTKVIIREPVQDFSAGRYILQFTIQKRFSNSPKKPNLEGRNEGYLDVPYSSGRNSKPERRGKMKSHRNPVIPEYKCPRHNIILPIGTRKCSYCDYKVERHKK